MPREYLPFEGWLFAGQFQTGIFYTSIEGIPLESLPVGEVQRDERSLAAGYGLRAYRHPFTALQTSDAGTTVAYLECTGPVSSAQGRVRQRKVLWLAPAAATLHAWAVWCVQQKQATLKSAHHRRQWQEVIDRKVAAIDSALPSGCAHVSRRRNAEGEYDPSIPAHELLDALCETEPRRCARNVWEAVRLALPNVDYGSGRHAFVRDSQVRLREMLLELAPKAKGGQS